MNTQEIYQKIEQLIHQYIEELDKYNEEQFWTKKADDVWSLGQMYEHLFSSNRFFIYQINNCLNQQKGALGGEKTEIGIKMYHYGTFPPIKIKIPEKWKGTEPVAQNKDFYKDNFLTILADLKILAQKVMEDSSNYKTEHVICGQLNSQEWYQMIEMHWRHHLRQKAELEEYVFRFVAK